MHAELRTTLLMVKIYLLFADMSLPPTLHPDEELEVVSKILREEKKTKQYDFPGGGRHLERPRSL